MSFVSIVARETWISVVTDGRCMTEDEVVDEHYQKFAQPDSDRFIAYAGDKDKCELVVRGMRELGHIQLGLEDSAKHMAGLIQEVGRRDFKLFMATGSVGPTGAEVYAFSTESNQPIILKPGTMDICYTFLSNNGVSEESLNKEFAKLIQKYGDCSPDKARQAQIELNTWAAGQDCSVNNITFTCELKA